MSNGTAFLKSIDRRLNDNLERKRAMILAWADEVERLLGYGEEGTGKGPRTAQIRRWYKDQGEPDIL